MAIAVLFIASAFYIMPTAKNIITIAKFNKTVAEQIIAVEKFDKTIEKFDKAVTEYIIAVAKFIKPIEKFDKAVAKFDEPTAKPKLTNDILLKPTAELKHHIEVQILPSKSLFDSKIQPIMVTSTEYKPTNILDKKTNITRRTASW